MIDIIIPVYNAQETLPLTLMSIYLQQVSIPYQVTLVDDCSEGDYQSIIDSFQDKMKIQYLRLDVNSGPGVAREYGIQHTGGDFITFIDSDDLFYDTDSLEEIFLSLTEDYDMVSGGEYEEDRNLFIINEGNLHGKFYRRQYLIDHDIHFNTTRVHEDNFFNSLVLLTGARNYNLDRLTYLYCLNPNSITQNQKEKEFERIQILLSNIHDLLEMVPLTYENTERIAHFIYIKYRYFNRIYPTLSEEQQNQLEDWILEYDPEHISFLGMTDNKKLQKEVYKSYGKIVLFED